MQHSLDKQHRCCREQDVKRVYYMSMEFLMGRSLLNALFNLDVTGQYGEALQEMGYSLESIVEQERDAVCSCLASFCLNRDPLTQLAFQYYVSHANLHVCVHLCAPVASSVLGRSIRCEGAHASLVMSGMFFRHWGTEGWGDWQHVSWTRWPPWTCLHGAMASATNMVRNW